jgi:cell cycle sensor histidine kinase DivJ
LRRLAAFGAIAEQVAGRVHASAADDPSVAPRHRAFIVSHLAIGVLPLACLPALIGLGGAPSALELACFAWSIAPILIALYLSRTGRLIQAHLLASLTLTALAAALAVATGGVWSFAAPWLALAPFEAALSGSRRTTLIAALASLAAFGLLALGSFAGASAPAADVATAATFGSMILAIHAAALLIRTMLAVGAGPTARAGQDGLDLLQDSSADLVTRHDRDGSITFASAAAQRVLGVPARELLGRSLLERVHVADRPAFLRGLSAPAQRATESSVEIRMRRDPASSSAPDFAWVEMRSRASEGSVIATFRDVSERKAHEAVLEEAREEAQRANEAKTRALATMSHELRTPLNAIIGFSEILADERLDRLAPERRSEYAALIHRSGEHLLELVDSVLDVTRLETGNFAIAPEQCAMAPIVRHCVGLMALKAQASQIRLWAEVQDGLPEIFADRRAVTQMLINLVSNAIKFTPRGGEVVVEAKAAPGALLIVVRDTGIGVSSADLARLGEAFFRAEGSANRRQQGTGLGLSVVRGLVDLHGGEMTIESKVDGGTRVCVTLPLKGAVASGQAVVRPASFPRSGPLHETMRAKVSQSA